MALSDMGQMIKSQSMFGIVLKRNAALTPLMMRLEYMVGSDRLRDVITRVTVLDRTI